MAELWDIYDEDRRPTGRLHPRGERLTWGYHLVVHVWIRDREGRWLITRRSREKSFPGFWESPGGCAIAGEDSLTAALRELWEETGLEPDPAQGERIHSYREDHFFCDAWRFQMDIDPGLIRLLPGETCDFRLAQATEIFELKRQGLFVPFQKLWPALC